MKLTNLRLPVTTDLEKLPEEFSRVSSPELLRKGPLKYNDIHDIFYHTPLTFESFEKLQSGLEDRIEKICQHLWGKIVEKNKINTGRTIGNILETTPRFADFLPSFLTLDGWEEILGIDVNNLKHMDNVREHGIWLLTHDKGKLIMSQTKRDIEIILANNQVHDVQEAPLYDLPTPQKDLHKAFKEFEGYFAGNLMDSLYQEYFSDKLLHGIHSANHDKESLYNYIFKTTEYIVFIDTSLRGWKAVTSPIAKHFTKNTIKNHSKDTNLSPETVEKRFEELQKNLHYMTCQVLGNIIPLLLERRKDFPSIDLFFKHYQQELKEAVNFDYSQLPLTSQEETKIHKARELYTEYLTTLQNPFTYISTPHGAHRTPIQIHPTKETDITEDKLWKETPINLERKTRIPQSKTILQTTREQSIQESETVIQ